MTSFEQGMFWASSATIGDIKTCCSCTVNIIPEIPDPMLIDLDVLDPRSFIKCVSISYILF